ncbi:MAG: guanylate kinase [Verrucomicrobiae bacterium]|nr:guanylate kinase [Verrucomicrobiae bacterium]
MDKFNKFFGKEIQRAPMVIVVSAPSGAGKTTLCGNLLKTDKNVVRAITCTTRTPRTGEKHGVDYYFLTREEFEKHINNGDFLEYAIVHGNYYGTLKSEVYRILQSGKDVLLNIDVQGAKSIREHIGKEPCLSNSLVTVFVGAEAIDVIKERLKTRGLDSAEEVKKRLNTAQQEMMRWNEFDYLIISGTMEEDLERLQKIICAERMRTRRITIQ